MSFDSQDPACCEPLFIVLVYLVLAGKGTRGLKISDYFEVSLGFDLKLVVFSLACQKLCKFGGNKFWDFELMECN